MKEFENCFICKEDLAYGDYNDHAKCVHRYSKNQLRQTLIQMWKWYDNTVDHFIHDE